MPACLRTASQLAPRDPFESHGIPNFRFRMGGMIVGYVCLGIYANSHRCHYSSLCSQFAEGGLPLTAAGRMPKGDRLMLPRWGVLDVLAHGCLSFVTAQLRMFSVVMGLHPRG